MSVEALDQGLFRSLDLGFRDIWCEIEISDENQSSGIFGFGVQGVEGPRCSV